MTKNKIFFHFSQKYTKNEPNDPLMVTMVIWKLIKLSIIDFILWLKLMGSVESLFELTTGGLNWQKPTISSISRQRTSMNNQITKASWYLNLKTIEGLSNIFIPHLKHISIVKSRLALITMGNMTKNTIFINFDKKTLKMSLMTPW